MTRLITVVHFDWWHGRFGTSDLAHGVPEAHVMFVTYFQITSCDATAGCQQDALLEESAVLMSLIAIEMITFDCHSTLAVV
jgi:hypothetical protein